MNEANNTETRDMFDRQNEIKSAHKEMRKAKAAIKNAVFALNAVGIALGEAGVTNEDRQRFQRVDYWRDKGALDLRELDDTLSACLMDLETMVDIQILHIQ